MGRAGARGGVFTLNLAVLATVAGCAGSDGWEDVDAEAEGDTLGQLEQGSLVGPQMSCLDSGSGLCSVRNMPLLLQTSELVDVGLRDMQGVGCYDTSMSMVIQTAIANRTSTAALAGRTLTYDSITAGNNGAASCTNPAQASACPTTKSYEQLSRTYLWAQQDHGPDEADHVAGVEPFHFPEVLNDFAGTKRVFPGGCNPDLYGNCSWNTLTSAAFVGVAGRDFTDGTSHVTNNYIKALMAKGVLPMIAFQRYRAKESPAGSKRIVFTKTAADGSTLMPHKVVFSGYHSLEYPLRINDVGSGGRANVTVTNDMSKIASYAGIPANQVVSFTFPNGKSKQTFIEYDPAGGDDGLVNFVEHIDYLTLSLPTDATGKQVFSGAWGGGWTSLMPFTLNGAACQLAYNSSTGDVHFDQFFANSNGASTVWSFTWGAGFTDFIPYYINGAPQFIAYNSADGQAHFDAFPANLQGPIIRAIRTWPTGLTSIVPFVMNGNNYLLMYNKNTGAVRIDLVNSAGSNSSVVWSSTWGTGFSSFVPHSINGEPYLVAYNATTGDIHYDRIQPSLNGVEVKKIGNIGAGLELAPLSFAGPGYFAAYTSDGQVRTHRLTLDGGDSGEVWKKTQLASATTLSSFTQDGNNYLLMYDKASGAVRSYALTLF